VGTTNNHGEDKNTKSLQEFVDKQFQSESDPGATSHMNKTNWEQEL
jgi:hypothetical protein